MNEFEKVYLKTILESTEKEKTFWYKFLKADGRYEEDRIPAATEEDAYKILKEKWGEKITITDFKEVKKMTSDDIEKWYENKLDR
jgi:type II secretory pathway component PulF